MKLLLLFVAVVSANFEPFGGFEGPFAQFMSPSFIRDANITVQQEWQNICYLNGTLEAQEQSQTAFGQKYDLAAQVAEFQENQTDYVNQLSQNISAIIANLTTVKESALTILNNKRQTKADMIKRLVNLPKTYGSSAEALYAIAAIALMGGHQHGGMMGAGGPMSFPTMQMGGMGPSAGGAPPAGFPNFQPSPAHIMIGMGPANIERPPDMPQPFGAKANFQG